MKEFKGTLTGVDPLVILDRNTKNNIDKFFLPLSLIYNDLKGLLLLDKTFREVYSEPNRNFANVHLGEFSGVRVQILRLVTGLVSEFFNYLIKNEKFINDPIFKHFEKRINKKIRNKWYKLLEIAFEDKSPKSDFLRKILTIRGNSIYHYSSKELPKAYINNFFNPEKNIGNEKAYFSIGESMETSRFYYADAAAERYLKENLQIELNENHHTKLLKTVKDMNEVLLSILTYYLIIKQDENKKVD